MTTEDIKYIQIRLNLVLKIGLVLDGDFGAKSKSAAIAFAEKNQQCVSKINDINALSSEALINLIHPELEKEYQAQPKFVIVVDAGHGGIDPATMKYTTPPENGKRYTHKGAKLHFEKDVFYEGLENRIAANEFIIKCREAGILAIPCFHPYLDRFGTESDSQELLRRPLIAEEYLKHGFSGYYHSFHSNAAGSKDDQATTDKIRGGIVFTTKGNTFSDTVSAVLLRHWKDAFGDSWCRFLDENKSGDENATINSDYEENFAVIRHSENLAAKFLTVGRKWGAILEEFGFFTSRPEAEWIIKPETRAKRVECALNCAKQIWSELNNKP